MASCWQPTVFRLRGLPSYVNDEASTASLISKALGGTPAAVEIKVCSLATVIKNPVTLESTKTATVMFSNLPEILLEKEFQNRQETELTCSNGNMILDTHFLGMTPLNDVVPPYRHEVNYIAISGLASHPFGSWQPRGRDKTFMWLRDELPSYFPTARVWLFGYNTNLIRSTSFQSIEDLAINLIEQLQLKTNHLATPAGQPMVFLAHSLGGIVLKQAIVRLATCGDSGLETLNLIKGGVMFGVPHFGMKQHHLCDLVGSQPNRTIIEDLAIHSTYLLQLHEKFSGHSYLHTMKLFYAYETQTTKTVLYNSTGSPERSGPPEVLVSRESATANKIRDDLTFQTFPIDKDHSEMVKFGLGDHMVQLVLDKLDKVLRHEIALDTTQVQPIPTPPGPLSPPLAAYRTASVPAVQQGPQPPPGTSNSARDLTGIAAIQRLPLFYSLNGHEHILPNANSYWRHLTLAAYEIYEKIYDRCKDDRGRVLYSDFAAQFLASVTPTCGTIQKTWSRLLRDQTNIAGSRHPKGLAMATLYMLHVERHLPHERPLDDDQLVGVSAKRRELLKAFGNWVACRCKSECGVKWNFANDTGLHRGGKPKSCFLAKFIDGGGKLGLFSSGKKEEAARETTWKDWLDSRMSSG